jgi:uncharacterized protein YejL (UPF0352 family)
MKMSDDQKEELRQTIRKMIDASGDHAINVFGQISLKEKLEVTKRKIASDFSEALINSIEKSVEAVNRLKQVADSGELKELPVKEAFYRVTDILFGSFVEDTPEGMHVFDNMAASFSVVEELDQVRFEHPYLEDTNYVEYITATKELVRDLVEVGVMRIAYQFIWAFKDTDDMYILLQATFQQFLEYYEYLAKDVNVIEKEHVDMYLTIYRELGSHYEKLVAFIVCLLTIVETKEMPDYERVKAKRVNANTQTLKKKGYDLFVTGFDRHVRNALAHGNSISNILARNVTFINRKRVTYSFEEVQRMVRELSAMLLVFPQLFLLHFTQYMAEVKNQIDSIDFDEYQVTK